MNQSTCFGSPAVNSACPNRDRKFPFRHSRRQPVNLQTRPQWAAEELRTSVFLILGVHNGRPVLNLILLCSTGISSMSSMPSIQSMIPSLPPTPSPQSAIRTTFREANDLSGEHIPGGLWEASSALCTLHSALCTLHSALCTLQLVFPPYIGDYRELSAFVFPPKTTQKLTTN
jgi:hypothetical protein